MTATAVLKYQNELWPNSEIVWFCNDPISDALKHSRIEIRPYPYLGMDSNIPSLTSGNRLSQERKHDLEATKDLSDGYFPAPWMLTAVARDGIDFPNISKMIFEIDMSREWHPFLSFSTEERNAAREFCKSLPSRKTIMLETECNSFQSGWNSPIEGDRDRLTRNTIRTCREVLGPCNFIFASLGDHSRFFDDAGVVSCSFFTPRQTALINDHCDMFIGVSSSISVATSCWNSRPNPKIQYCNSRTCSTAALALGKMTLVCPNEVQNRLQGEEKDVSLHHTFDGVLRTVLRDIR